MAVTTNGWLLSGPCVGILVVCVSTALADERAAQQLDRGWSWQEVEQPKNVPTLCFESAATFDTSIGRLVLFGGHGQRYSGSQRDQTWLYDPATNSWTNPEPANRPIGACCVREMVYDPANRRSYYFGGHSLNHGWQWRPPRPRGGGIPWVFDAAANTWHPGRPLANRTPKPVTGAVYDSEHQVAIIYGGEGFYDDTVWVYDGYSNTWEALKREGEGPEMGGHCPPMAFDPERKVVLMYGHGYAKDSKNELWAYDLRRNRWRALNDAGRPARKGWVMMVYDPLNRVPVLFSNGGKRLEAFAYRWKENAWERLQVRGTPPPPYTVQQGAYDPVRHQTIFANGGIYNVQNRPATYLLRHARPAPSSTRLPAPSGLRVVVVEGGRAELAFAPVAGAEGYIVYRGTGARPWEVAFRTAGRTKTTRFADPGLTSGAVHHYYVRAVDAQGREGTPSFKVRTQPRPPLQMVVSALDKERVEIAWARSGEQDIVGYNVYAFSSLKKAGYRVQAEGLTRLNRAPLADTSHVHRVPVGEEPGLHYLVRAVNRLGVESGPSPWATALPSEPTGVAVQEEKGKVVVTWRPNPEKNIQGYNIYRKDGSSGLDAKKVAGPIQATRFVDRSKTDRQTCKYYVTAVDVLGREGYASYGAWFNDDGRN